MPEWVPERGTTPIDWEDRQPYVDHADTTAGRRRDELSADRPGSGAGISRRGPALVVAASVILGLAVRTYFLLTPAGALDGDEAVTGIMAHRIADGQDLYTFFAGQRYNSAIEQYPQALLFYLGVPETAFTLRLPQLAMGAVSIWLFYLVGLRLLQSRWHAALASLLFALGPYFVIWKGVRSQGSYVAEIVVILLGLICALELTEPIDPRRRRWLACAFGVLFGASYSLNASGYFLLLPAALWIVPSLWRRWGAVAAGAAGGLVAAIPLVYWTISTGDLPIPDPGIRPTTPGERFGNLTDEVGRQFFGVAYVAGEPGWPVTLGRAVVWLFLLGALAAILWHLPSIVRLITFRAEGRRPFDVVLLAVPITVIGYTASEYAWFTTEPRYLFAALPVLVLALARLPPNRARVGPLVAAGVLVFVALPSTWMVVSRADDAPAGREGDLEEAVDVLVREETTEVYANYWTAMPLQFVAEDRLTVGSLIEPRFLEDRREVDAAPNPVWVAAAGVNIDDRPAMRSALEASGIDHRERMIGLVSIFDRFSRPVRPWEIGLGVEAPA